MYGMTCPHCGAATGFSPVGERKQVEMDLGNPTVAKRATGSIYDNESGNIFGLSRCQACGKAFPVRGKAHNTEAPDITVEQGTLEPLWPTRYRTVAQEIPTLVRAAMEDASAALGAGSMLGAILATRTAVIRAQRQQKEELQLSAGSLKALVDAGRISKYTFEGSDTARRVANYLGHEEPDPEKEYTKDDAEELYDFVEALLDELYVKPARIQSHRARLVKNQTETDAKTGQQGMEED